jgi:hypothetical protein
MCSLAFLGIGKGFGLGLAGQWLLDEALLLPALGLGIAADSFSYVCQLRKIRSRKVIRNHFTYMDEDRQ